MLTPIPNLRHAWIFATEHDGDPKPYITRLPFGYTAFDIYVLVSLVAVCQS